MLFSQVDKMRGFCDGSQGSGSILNHWNFLKHICTPGFSRRKYMKQTIRYVALLAIFAALIDTASSQPSYVGQSAPSASAPASFSAIQLEDLIAPIALYPDPLIAAILPAAAHPADIASAARFVTVNNSLTDLEKLGRRTPDDTPADGDRQRSSGGKIPRNPDRVCDQYRNSNHAGKSTSGLCAGIRSRRHLCLIANLCLFRGATVDNFWTWHCRGSLSLTKPLRLVLWRCLLRPP